MIEMRQGPLAVARGDTQRRRSLSLDPSRISRRGNRHASQRRSAQWTFDRGLIGSGLLSCAGCLRHYTAVMVKGGHIPGVRVELLMATRIDASARHMTARQPLGFDQAAVGKKALISSAVSWSGTSPQNWP